MQPQIKTFSETKFVGKRITMSFAANKTKELWQSFMPEKKHIAHVIGTDLYSIEVYPLFFFMPFNPQASFEKWAAVPVSKAESLPAGMHKLLIPSGLYAVFIHKGPASAGHKTYGAIFSEWLPYAAYTLDNRPHFAVMGKKYRHEHADSEGEIWIPIIPKASSQD